MKKLVLKVLVLTVVALIGVSCDKEKVVSTEDLPNLATTFLNEHFNGVTVLSIVKEKEALSATEYEVLLNNGIEVKFDKNGNWDELDARDKNAGIPRSFILPNIVNYVATKYPEAFINGIDKEKSTFEVELTNGLELVFDQNGNFPRIDA